MNGFVKIFSADKAAVAHSENAAPNTYLFSGYWVKFKYSCASAIFILAPSYKSSLIRSWYAFRILTAFSTGLRLPRPSSGSFFRLLDDELCRLHYFVIVSHSIHSYFLSTTQMYSAVEYLRVINNVTEEDCFRSWNYGGGVREWGDCNLL